MPITEVPVDVAADMPPPVITVPPPKAKKPPPEPDKEKDEDDDKEDGKEKGGLSPTLRKLQASADMATKEWLDAIVGESPIRVAIHRKEPKYARDPETQEMIKVDGRIDSVDKTVDEDEIHRKHGGGTYQLVVQTKSPAGNWRYFGAKTIELAGEPNLKSIPRIPQKDPTVAAPAAPVKDPTEGKVIDKLTSFLMEENRAARNAPAPAPVQTGLSPESVALMLKPLELQIKALTDLLAQKDRELADVRANAGKDPFRDKMLDALMDGDSKHVQKLRDNHEAEVRQLKEGFKQTLELERARFERDLDRVEKAHERELSSLKQSLQQSIDLAKTKGDITESVLKRESDAKDKVIDRQDRELEALRAKKDMSIKDKVDELNSIKELVGGDGDEESTFEKVIGAVGNLPVVAKLAERMAGGGEQAQAQQKPQRMLVRDKESGQVSVRETKADGTVTMRPVSRKPQAVTTEGGQQVEIPPIDPEQMRQAITFMEAAFRSNTDPEMFATSARPYINSAMMGAMRALGPLEFMSKVGKVDAMSTLSTFKGKQWVKKVVAALLGANDEQPEAPAAPAEALPGPEAPAA